MPQSKNIIFYTAIIILSIIPISIWITMYPLGDRFINLNTTLTSLGQISGLIGMTLLCLVFIVNIFKKFKIHHSIGTISFILLIFHPLFLAAKYLALSTKQAALFLLPGIDWSINYGIIALLVMEILLILTFFIKLKPVHWKASHMLLGIAFFFSILHVFLIQSDISRNIFLRYYIFALIIIGIISLAYRIWHHYRETYKPKISEINEKDDNKNETQL